MNNERYAFIEDVRERKALSRGSRCKINGSKSRKCTLPHESLTPAQLRERNGKIVSFNMNGPMTINTFVCVPADLKGDYLRRCVDNGATVTALANMLGVSTATVRGFLLREGVQVPSGHPSNDRLEKWAAFCGTSREPVEETTSSATTEEDVNPDIVEKLNVSTTMTLRGTPRKALLYALTTELGMNDVDTHTIIITIKEEK